MFLPSNLGLLLVAVALVGVLAGSRSGQADETAELGVVAVVEASCRLEGATLDFGSYRPEANQPNRAQTSFRYRCPPGMEISLNLGPGGQPEGRERGMVQGGERLAYQLYKDAARRQIWGDGSFGGDGKIIPSTPDEGESVDVFGEIPAGQSVGPGTYRDIVVMTLIVNP